VGGIGLVNKPEADHLIKERGGRFEGAEADTIKARWSQIQTTLD
jgi:hypothetical protein